MICWINPFTGLAGDMLLAALIDAGAPLPAIRNAIEATGLTGWSIGVERVVEHGLAVSRLRIEVDDDKTHRAASELISMAGRVRPEPIAAFAVSALGAIAGVEARLHGTPPEKVHLHELGGHDTIVDVVGVAAALHSLGIDQVRCAPLPLGSGRVNSAHGFIPCPAPATLALLEGAAVAETDLTGETVTPTGAALLRAADAHYGSPPTMTLRATGYGAGTRRLPDRPNVVAVTLGEPIAAEKPHPSAPSTGHRESVLVLETNLDDVTGETLAHTIAEAITAGARDAWTTPAVMKKGRPAHVLHVLTGPEHAEQLEQLMLTQTGALGIRHVPATRTVLPRRTETVELDACVIRIKIGPHGAKPEHDDVAAAARRLGLPLRIVAQRALDRHARRPLMPSADEEEAADGHTEP